MSAQVDGVERIAVFLDADRQSSCVQKVPVLWELWRAFVPAWRRYSYLQNLLDFFLVSIVGTMLQHDRHCNWHKVLFAGSQVDHGQHLRTWHICWHLQCALPWLYYDTCQLKQGRGFVTYRSTGTQNNNQLWHAREVERLKVSMTVGLFVFLHPPPLITAIPYAIMTASVTIFSKSQLAISRDRTTPLRPVRYYRDVC